MSQLSLFDSGEFYKFPKDLLEYREHFLSSKQADELKDNHKGINRLRELKRIFNILFKIMKYSCLFYDYFLFFRNIQ